MLFFLILTSCKINYTFSGYSIEPDVKTATILQFPNNAEIVVPTLSQDFSEEFREKIISEVNLQLLPYDGDIQFEGNIIGYSVNPTTFTGNTEQAAQNRLTISVKVIFTNQKHPEKNWESTFSRFSDFDASQNLSDVEADLILIISTQLIDDIFNKAFVNW